MSWKAEKPPFGWKRLKSGAVVRCAVEQRVLRRIRACLKAGISYGEIMEALRDAGIVGGRLR